MQALRAAFGNPDRAFEFLMSGIPAEGMGAAGGDVGDDDYGDEEGSADVGAGAGGNPFAALASNPNFALIRQRILQDPNFYQ
jgi:UV excision repair protein RAD23